jgi:hypothetical protein
MRLHSKCGDFSTKHNGVIHYCNLPPKEVLYNGTAQEFCAHTSSILPQLRTVVSEQHRADVSSYQTRRVLDAHSELVALTVDTESVI